MSEINTWLLGGGFTVGIVFGVVVQRFRFCLVAAVSNLLLINDRRQIVAFAMALVIAITGTQLLEIMEIVVIADSVYRNNILDWFGAVVGGVIFGVGAVLSGGCAARTIIKTMEGNIHSLLALLSFSIVAAITQFGFLESIRIDLTHITSIELTTDAGIASVLSWSKWSVLVIIAISLVLFIYKSSKQASLKTMLIVGSVVGMLVVISWYVTGVLAQDEFNYKSPSAMTMSGPLARFGYVVISGRVPELSFSILFVIGMALSSLLSALTFRQFKITAPAKGMAKMAIFGGALMGAGGILAYGCNVGQGLSGISTLSIESVLAVAGMVGGITAATKWMEKMIE